METRGNAWQECGEPFNYKGSGALFAAFTFCLQQTLTLEWLPGDFTGFCSLHHCVILLLSKNQSLSVSFQKHAIDNPIQGLESALKGLWVLWRVCAPPFGGEIGNIPIASPVCLLLKNDCYEQFQAGKLYSILAPSLAAVCLWVPMLRSNSKKMQFADVSCFWASQGCQTGHLGPMVRTPSGSWSIYSKPDYPHSNWW